MSVGIYCYRDSLNDNSVVYVGKDSYIHKNTRHKDHMSPSNYDAQQINRVLQNNPDRYKYEVLKSWESDEYHPNLLNALEIIYIRRYRPKFCYTIGGDGSIGYKHSHEAKLKISEAGMGRHHTEETKRKISESLKGEKSPLWKNYPRIVRNGYHKGDQMYSIVFNGKVVRSSTDLNKLELELKRYKV